MATRKRVVKSRKAKATPKPQLTKAILKIASSKATAKAHREGFEYQETQLIAKDGWLVRVNRKGEVMEKVEPLLSKELRKRLKRRA